MGLHGHTPKQRKRIKATRKATSTTRRKSGKRK